MEARIQILDLNDSKLEPLEKELLDFVVGGKEPDRTTSFFYDVAWGAGWLYEEVKSWF